VSRYDHVIWDWNGTLLDDVHLTIEIMDWMLAPRGLPPLDVDRYHEVFGFPVRDYYERLGFDFEREPFEELAVEFISEYQRRWRECDLQGGARDTVSALAGAGVGQSVLSAMEQGLLHEHRDHFELGDLEAFVGIDDHHGGSKLDHGLRRVAALGHDPSRVLLVGDTEHDHEVAQAMGVDCVLVEGGHASRTRLESRGARVLPSPSAVADYAAQ
jgi:phosphoglycolate phosphatase